MYVIIKSSMTNLKHLCQEYKEALNNLNVAKQMLENECRVQFDKCDKNESGSISVGEYLSTLFESLNEMDYNSLRKALDEQMDQFKNIDHDGDGLLTFEELLQFQYTYSDE